MTAQLAQTYQLNKKLEAGKISFAKYHIELLKINGEQ